MTLADVRKVSIPRHVAAATFAHLRSCGSQGLEGMVFWTGTIEEGGSCSLKEAYVPKQVGERTAHGLVVSVDGDELHAINVHLEKTGERLVAQVHSHPGRAYHSAWDNAYAVVTQIGGFSIVVPDFATGAFDMERFAVHRLLRSRLRGSGRPRWRRLRAARTRAIFDLEYHDGIG